MENTMMTREEMHDYCLTFRNAECNYKEEWNAFLYQLEGKMFAMMANNADGTAIISLKCSPAWAEELREMYAEIVPGYYLNKKHWNSIPIKNKVPDKLMKEMIAHAYKLIYEALPKKTRDKIGG